MATLTLLLVVGAFGLTALLTQRRRTRLLADPTTHPGLLALDRRTVQSRWIGLGTGLLLAAVAAGSQPLGRGLLLAPALLACGLVLAQLVAQLTAWRSARTPGVAALESRTATRYLPRTPLALLAGGTALLAVVLLWCRSRQNRTPDELGTIGRQFTWSSADGLASGSAGPFPGTYYSAPLTAVVLGTLLLTAAGLAMALLRPRNGADPVVVAVDDQVRTRSMEGLVGSGLVAVAGSLACAALMAGLAAFQYSPLAGSLLLALCCASLVTLSWALAVVLVPGRGERLS
ncbi:hypothetical protein [Luteococcus peritonei]|uniref:Uncharacterized protein n=1 Tax=Luteococcus peritonei TaxID=88874 RepID=A0ABW4RUF2_9ACTN